MKETILFVSETQYLAMQRCEELCRCRVQFQKRVDSNTLKAKVNYYEDGNLFYLGVMSSADLLSQNVKSPL